MKAIREVSDIHLDWDIGSFRRVKQTDPSVSEEMDMLWYPPSMDDDLDSTFIVAGDLWVEGHFANRKYQQSGDPDDTWIKRMSRKFKYVIVVLGNHDYWGTNVLFEPDKIKKSIADQGLTNVFLLEKDCVVLDQVKFIGGTLWTDYNRNDPLVMLDAPNFMKDYKFMRFGTSYRRCMPHDLVKIFTNTKAFIFENAKRDYPEQKVIVVTHMAPSYQSIGETYRRPEHTKMNYLYYSDLETQILYEGQDIDYWFHGHVHHRDEYEIGNCRVVMNPRGYSTENPFFEPTMQFQL